MELSFSFNKDLLTGFPTTWATSSSVGAGKIGKFLFFWFKPDIAKTLTFQTYTGGVTT